MKRWYLLMILVSTVMFSCQKELSFDSDNAGGDSTSTPVTNACIMTKIDESDSASGSPTYTYIYSLGTDRKVGRVQAVDSMNRTVYSSFLLTYNPNRIMVGADQYFVTDASGRVSEFHGYEDPENRLGYKIIAKYTYNTAGQLTLRTQSFDSIPNAIRSQQKFTYNSGNLSRETLEFYNGASFVTYSQIDYTFDVSKPVKGFLNIYGATPELVVFGPAINAGINNTHAVTRTVIAEIDLSGSSKVRNVTTYSKYVMNANNYVTSFHASGDDFNVGGLYAGMKYVLSYSCY